MTTTTTSTTAEVVAAYYCNYKHYFGNYVKAEADHYFDKDGNLLVIRVWSVYADWTLPFTQAMREKMAKVTGLPIACVYQNGEHPKPSHIDISSAERRCTYVAENIYYWEHGF